MDISVFGLGYVGCVCAAGLGQIGHRITGVDISPGKVDALQAGRSPIVEAGLDPVIAQMKSDRLITATNDVDQAIRNTNISIICVGTPSHPDKGVQLDAVKTVTCQIGESLRTKQQAHTVILKSTVPPGTTEDIVAPLLEETSGKRLRSDLLMLYYNPEFLREGSSLSDFHAPPYTIMGVPDPQSSHARDLAEALFSSIKAPILYHPIRIAESVKYLSNSFHALKVCFANEAASILRTLGISDPKEAIDLFLRDRILNISDAYLHPGFAFGGSCLPKDVRALNHLASKQGISSPLFSSLLDSNQAHIDRALNLILDNGPKHILLMGLSFKSGTDDLRESPYITLLERLLAQNVNIQVYDRDVDPDRLIGANLEQVSRLKVPLDSLLVTDLEQAVRDAQTIVYGHSGDSGHALLNIVNTSCSKHKTLVDLSGRLDRHEIKNPRIQFKPL